jgi:hypothetical protein
MRTANLKLGKVLRGPIFSEPVQIIVAPPLGDGMKVIGHSTLIASVKALLFM